MTDECEQSRAYYHVVIRRVSSRTEYVAKDLTKELLRTRVTDPFNAEKTVTVGGRQHPFSSIACLRVFVTDVEFQARRVQLWHAEVDRAGQQAGVQTIPPLADAKVAESGREVTDQFITGPSWEGASPSPGQLRDPYEVFVAHGRNEIAKAALFQLLSALGLKPLPWDDLVRDTRDGAPPNFHVVQAGLRRAQAVVVLMTPDDEVRLRPELQDPSRDKPDELTFKYQARPNVFFEAGLAMGMIVPSRTIIVQLGNPKPSSDLHGKSYVLLDGTEACRKALAERLRTAGCAVNTSDEAWKSAGDFKAALNPGNEESPPGVTSARAPNEPVPTGVTEQIPGAAPTPTELPPARGDAESASGDAARGTSEESIRQWSVDRGLDSARLLAEIGRRLLGSGRLLEALDYYRRALKFDRESGSQEGIAEDFSDLGAVYVKQAQLAQVELDHLESDDPRRAAVAGRAKRTWPRALKHLLEAYNRYMRLVLARRGAGAPLLCVYTNLTSVFHAMDPARFDRQCRAFGIPVRDINKLYQALLETEMKG